MPILVERAAVPTETIHAQIRNASPGDHSDATAAVPASPGMLIAGHPHVSWRRQG